jgi:glycosyltransferase involved in cell wall biosynthesis
VDSLVSVIVPAYNAADSLPATLDSVISQTYRRTEVLVVDDGSSDATAEIACSYARRDARVRLLQQSNAGVAAARNLALRQSTGEFVAPIDADDIWYPEKLAKQVDRLNSSGPEVGVVYCGSVYIDAHDQLTGHWCSYGVEGRVLEALLYRNFVGNASTPLIRRSHLEQVDLYDVELRAQNAQGLEDWDLYLRLAEVCEFRVVPELLVGYRQSDQNMSADLASMERSYRLVMQAARDRHPELPKRLFRWSAGDFYLYFVRVSLDYRADWRAASYWLVRALTRDRTLPLQARLYGQLLKSLRRRMTGGRWEQHLTHDDLDLRRKRTERFSFDPYNRRVRRIQRSLR